MSVVASEEALTAVDSVEGLCLHVVDTVPLFRRGLTECCDDLGLLVREHAKVDDLPPDARPAAVVLVIRQEADWIALGEMCARQPEVPVLVILQRLLPLVVRRAIALGAYGVTDMAAPLDHFVGALRAALAGFTVLPHNVASDIVCSDSPNDALTPVTIDWLRDLASGKTVADLAERVGYSEREMHRHLSRVYVQLGADNRTDALLTAQRVGLIE